MNNEYVIINKSLLEKRIEELENVIEEKKIGVENERWLKHELKHILSQSTPLIPEIKKAYKKGFTEGTCFGATTIYKYETSEDYISNLKLDI